MEPGSYVPGFFAEVPTQHYHDDTLCEGVTLNQTVGKEIVDSCPAKARFKHPRLNPEANSADTTRAMDRGSVAHTLLLGRGKAFDVIPFDSRRSKDAKTAVAAAEAGGRIAITVDEYQRAAAMVTEARAQLVTIDRYAFDSDYGYSELCILAQDPVGPMTRALVDWYGDRHPDGLTLWDYKTLEGSANPLTLRWHMTRQGWAFQAAWQARILHWLKPELQPRFRFLAQETSPPFLCSVVEPDPGAMVIAHKMVAAAIGIWQRCMETGIWPGYPTESRAIGVTPGTEAAWVEREYDPTLAGIMDADPFLSNPVTRDSTTIGLLDRPAEPQERPRNKGGRPRLTDEQRAQRAAQRAGGASQPQPAPTARKLDL